MDPTKEQLQEILESLPPGKWENPHIFSYDEESRDVLTRTGATKPGTGEMYYYEPDTGDFEPLRLPGTRK